MLGLRFLLLSRHSVFSSFQDNISWQLKQSCPDFPPIIDDLTIVNNRRKHSLQTICRLRLHFLSIMLWRFHRQIQSYSVDRIKWSWLGHVLHSKHKPKGDNYLDFSKLWNISGMEINLKDLGSLWLCYIRKKTNSWDCSIWVLTLPLLSIHHGNPDTTM